MSREIFRGTIPDGLLYDTTYDMWVRRDGETVTIGATSFGIHLAGEIIAFTPKPNGAEVARGRGLGTVECAKTALFFVSDYATMVTGAVLDVNGGEYMSS